MADVSQPSPLQAARQRAQALADSGDLGQARAALEHAVGLGRVNLGEDDPEVLVTAQQLAVVYQRAGDPSGARRVLEEAYAAGQWRLGDADPVMVGISFDLGVVAEEMENRHEARRAFSRVVAHGPGALGADHWAVLRARSYLGEDPPTVRMELSTPPPQREVAHFPDRSAQAAPQLRQTAPPDFQQAAPPAHHQQAPAHHHQQQQQAPAHLQQAPAFDLPYQQPRFEPPAVHHSAPQVISVPPVTTAVPAGAEYSRKAPGIFAAIAAVFGVIIAVVALVVVLANRGDEPDSDVPTLSGPAPTDVRLRDYGSSVQLSWSDPANGRTSFVVTGGRPGEQLGPMGQVGPTTTKFDLHGLNPDLDYCFAIVAVYSTSQFATSPQSCTSRGRPSGRPTATK